MCQKCTDAIKEYWPNLPEHKWSDLLMNCTCFPFGDHEQVAKHLKEMAEKSGQDLNRACQIACDEMDAAHEQYKKDYPI